MPSNVSLYMYKEGGAKMPFSSTASTGSANLFGTPQWQIGGVYCSTIAIPFTAISSPQTQAFAVPLGFPSFTLSQGAAANVIVSTAIADTVTGSVIFSIPKLTLNVQGSGVKNAAAGVSQFNLKAGRSYSGFTLQGTLTAYAPSGAAAQTVYLTVQAFLLGLPAQS
jgi:hypothetical protein